VSDADPPPEAEPPEQSPRHGIHLGWLTVLLIVAALVFFSATSPLVYGTTQTLAAMIFGEDVANDESLGVSLAVIVHKAFGFFSFGLLAILAHKALGPTRHPIWRAVIVGTLFSVLIEIWQFAAGLSDDALSETFDVLRGTAGGWLVAVIFRFKRS
jgi:glycopeptide antibiotics resistance protein